MERRAHDPDDTRLPRRCPASTREQIERVDAARLGRRRAGDADAPRGRAVAGRVGVARAGCSPASTASAPLLVCGMGGSAIGGDLADGGARRPPDASRCARSAATSCRPGRRPTRSCCARATPATPRRRSPATRPRARSARPRVAVTTGGRLAEAARADGVPVIPLPGGPAAARGGRLHARVACSRWRRSSGVAPRAADRDRRRRGARSRSWRASGGRTPTPTASRSGSPQRVHEHLRVRLRRRARPPPVAYALEDPDQREREGAGVLRPSCPRPTTTRSSAGTARRRSAASWRCSSRTPTSTRACASGSS